MKKINYKINLLISLLIFGATFTMFAQKADKASVKPEFEKHLTLQALGGISQYYGELNPQKYYNDKMGFFYNFGLGFNFHPVWGIRGAFNNGKIKALNNDLKEDFSSSIWDGELQLTSNLSNLIGGYKDRFLNFYLFAGGGLTTYSSMVVSSDDRTIKRRSGKYVTDADVAADKENFDKTIGHDFVVPVGLGVSMRLAKKLDFIIEGNYKFNFGDKIDITETKKGNDSYSSLMAGFSYKIFPSCDNLSSMLKNYDQVRYEVTPDPLVAVGDSVCANVKITFPPKYFLKKAAMAWQPELKYSGNSMKLKPVNFQGEKVNGNGIVISYENGGTYTYTECFLYQPGMENSTLNVAPAIYAPSEPVDINATPENINNKYKALNVPQHKLADGVIKSDNLITNDQVATMLGDKYEKDVIISEFAHYYFKVNQYDINNKLPLNVKNNVNKQLDGLTAFIDKGYKIRDIELNAWASPEGEEGKNKELSVNRAKAGNKIIVEIFKKLAKNKNSNVKIDKPEAVLNIKEIANGEDWDGFIAAVKNSNINDKDKIVNIINSQNDILSREKEIRNMLTIYKEVEENILPPLRRVEIKVNTFKPQKSDNELLNLAQNNTSSLTVEEALYATTLTNDKEQQLTIFNNITSAYPNDSRAFNNAAAIELDNNNLAKAANLLEKAEKIDNNNSAILVNLGILNAKQNNLKKAMEYYNKAKGLGADVNYNIGIIEITKGHYSNALSLMGNKNCNSNVALAKLLSSNYNEAISMLRCAPESAQNYYLLAIAGARTNDAVMLVDNLKKAIAAKPEYKAKAMNDREFFKFFDNTEFKNLLK